MASIRGLVTALLLVQQTLAQSFTISNGQIFTPGFVVLDAPQPNTPLGGDTLHVAIDVTANGKLALPPHGQNDPSQIFNVTMFLYSYTTGRNFTISNGTASANNASLGEIMTQEPGSTVKHINWVWPDCLVGNGVPDGDNSDRGTYNISIRQNFRLNGEDHYTIFDVPIAVTNSIEEKDDRPACDSLTNELLSYEEIDAETANKVGVLFAPGDATEVETPTETEIGTATGTSTETRKSTETVTSTQTVALPEIGTLTEPGTATATATETGVGLGGAVSLMNPGVGVYAAVLISAFLVAI